MSEAVEVTLVLPERSEDALSEGLRLLTSALVERGMGESSFGLGGTNGYGAPHDSGVFAMRPFCWCDADDCPWCGGCDCRSERWTYTVEGHPATRSEWVAAYDAGLPREQHVADPDCDYCTGRGVFATNGAEPGMGAPNFWHKPTGLKVWWYKYIGRGMKVVNPNNASIADVIRDCLNSIEHPHDSASNEHSETPQLERTQRDRPA